MTIKTRNDIEVFAYRIATKMEEIPENLRLLLIIPPDDFKQLVNEINPLLESQSLDRFIYNSQVGVEFGIKQQS